MNQKHLEQMLSSKVIRVVHVIPQYYPSPEKPRDILVRSTKSMAGAEQEIRHFILSFSDARLDVSTSRREEVKRNFSHFCEEFGIEDDVLFIRPSGNPATPQILLSMIESGEIEYTSQEITSIDNIRTFCGGNGAVATFTQYAKFDYKGKSIEDIAKITVVLERDERKQHKWKLIHSHRGPGHKPLPDGQKRSTTIRQMFL